MPSLLAVSQASATQAYQAAGGTAFELAGFAVPWSWIFVAVVIVVGLLIIRTAFTLIKVAILVGAAIAVWLIVQFVVSNWLPSFT